MCFSPFVSLLTAGLEILLVLIMFTCFRKSVLRNFFAALITLLGIYQFTEYMSCSNGNPYFWATVGFITYSFMPAVALHGALAYFRKRKNILLLYGVPVLATIIALSPRFVQQTVCAPPFIAVTTLLTKPHNLVFLLSSLVYNLYYIGFLLAIAFLFYAAAQHEKNKKKEQLNLMFLLGIVLMVLPTYVLLFLFPQWNIMFPSVLCKFAFFFAVCIFLGFYLEGKR